MPCSCFFCAQGHLGAQQINIVVQAVAGMFLREKGTVGAFLPAERNMEVEACEHNVLQFYLERVE